MGGPVDLVADVGESFGAYTIGDDERLLEVLSAANIACGFHAGDPRTMMRTVSACVEKGVAIGAHPGFPDLVGFGRRDMAMTRDEVRTDVLYQLGALSAFVRAAGGTLGHLSPHGQLGNLTATDETYANGVLDAIEDFDPTLKVIGPPGLIHQLAEQRGIASAGLAFPDRSYEASGLLTSRRLPGAVLDDPQVIASRAVTMILERRIESRTGEQVPVDCDAILLHGDNPASVQAARAVRSALEEAGVTVGAAVRG
jgi:5-oxoprolinase (ATP-hydrolysing) subunit A